VNQGNAVIDFKPAPALAMQEAELVSVLQTSLYPGAKLESIKMVIGYCKAAGLDPMQKPVHIVPMSVKVGDGYQMRDVIMPGVGLYRTQAARSNALAGISEPEFGPTKSLKVNDSETEYPEWCRVTVKRMVQGTIVDFTAVEYWLENYATKGRDSKVPNAMWAKRPRGQIAKCAQAQALRMAFPEMTGSQPTADELEGKTIDGDFAEVERPAIAGPQSKSAAQQPDKAEQSADQGGAQTGAVSAAEGKPASPLAKPSMVKMVKAKLEAAAITDQECFKANGVESWETITFDQVNAVLQWLLNPAGN
jgi:phage recombination protein Bet